MLIVEKLENIAKQGKKNLKILKREREKVCGVQEKGTEGEGESLSRLHTEGRALDLMTPRS